MSRDLHPDQEYLSDDLATMAGIIWRRHRFDSMDCKLTKMFTTVP
jgi:hypothetical protein